MGRVAGVVVVVVSGSAVGVSVVQGVGKDSVREVCRLCESLQPWWRCLRNDGAGRGGTKVGKVMIAAGVVETSR